MTIAKHYIQPAFLICAALLALSAAGMSFAIKKFGVHLKKEPLLLKKPLDLLDEKKLAPYKVIVKSTIENEEVIKSLGTEDYIQWVLQDPDVAPDSTVRRCLLFVTYYRRPDRVPHVPEECYTGGGFQKIASDNIAFEINEAVFDENNSNDGKKYTRTRKIEGKYLVFGNTASGNFWANRKFPVLYLFKVNGEYAASREEARIALNKNLFSKFSYFCKVEMVFNQGFNAPAKEDAVAAGQKLLNIVLPILEKEHWPKWGK